MQRERSAAASGLVKLSIGPRYFEIGGVEFVAANMALCRLPCFTVTPCAATFALRHKKRMTNRKVHC